MSLSETDIVNIAVRDIGATEITDIDTDDGKVANTVRTYWPAVIDEGLRAHKWTFAKVMKALAADGDYTMVDARYAYAYQKPSDYIRMSRMNVKGTKFEIRGEHILTNSSPLIVEYIYRHVTAIKWPSYFYMALAAHLASFIVTPLSKKGTKKIDWSQVYMFRLEQAMAADSLEDDPMDADDGLHTVENEPWLQVMGATSTEE